MWPLSGNIVGQVFNLPDFLGRADSNHPHVAIVGQHRGASFQLARFSWTGKLKTCPTMLPGFKPCPCSAGLESYPTCHPICRNVSNPKRSTGARTTGVARTGA